MQVEFIVAIRDFSLNMALLYCDIVLRLWIDARHDLLTDG